MSEQVEFGCESPQWFLTRWLVEPGGDIPDSMRQTLLRSLYGSVPIFAGGVLNTIMVSSLVAMRMQTTAAYIWVGLEILLAALRLPLLIIGRRKSARSRQVYTDLYILLAVAWASSVGYGTFMCMASGDWIAATLACLSAGAMVGGICFRNFGAPRLVAVMIVLSLGPCAVAAALSGHQILLLVVFEIPFYLVSISIAAFQLKRLLVRTMHAEMQNDYHARHDPLTGLLNRGGLTRWLESREPNSTSPVAAFYLDLDWFKSVNDTFGHKAGDDVLVEVAIRLRQLLGNTVQIARLGGDEFVVIADGMSNADAVDLAKRISQTVASQGYEVGGDIAAVGASVGMAHSDKHGSDVSQLLIVADMELNGAKSANHAELERKVTTNGIQARQGAQRGNFPRRKTVAAYPPSAHLAATRRARRRVSVQLNDYN